MLCDIMDALVVLFDRALAQCIVRCKHCKSLSSSADNLLTLIFHCSLIFQHDDLVNRTKDLKHCTKLVFCHSARDLPNKKFHAIGVWLLWVIIWAVLSMRSSNALYANSATFKLHSGLHWNALVFNIQRYLIKPFVMLQSLKIPVTIRTALLYTKWKFIHRVNLTYKCKEEFNQWISSGNNPRTANLKNFELLEGVRDRKAFIVNHPLITVIILLLLSLSPVLLILWIKCHIILILIERQHYRGHAFMSLPCQR